MVLEASCGAFWWADRIEEQSAQCHVLNPHRFRIIKDSWNKTDRQDARNMAKALWVYLVTDEFGIPTVHKPTLVIRELRKLFSGYDLINRQLRTLKNSIQAALVDEGVVLSSRGKSVYGHRREPFGVRGCLSYDKGNSWDYETRLLSGTTWSKESLGIRHRSYCRVVQCLPCTGTKMQKA